MTLRASGAFVFGAGLTVVFGVAACGSVANKSGAGGATGSGGTSAAGGVTGSGGTLSDAGAGGAIDAPVDSGGSDGPVAACDLTKPFGTPALVTSLNTGFQEIDVWLTDDSRTA